MGVNDQRPPRDLSRGMEADKIDVKEAFYAADALAAEVAIELRRRKEALSKINRHPLRLQVSGLDDVLAEKVYLAALAGRHEEIQELLAPWYVAPAEEDEEAKAAEAAAAAAAVAAAASAAAASAKGKNKKGVAATAATAAEEEEAAAAAEKPAAPTPWQIEDVYGFDPLSVASAAGHVDAVKALLDCGADLNANNRICGRTALHRAAAEGREKVVDILLTRGISATATARDGAAALHAAAAVGHVPVLSRLLQEGPADARDFCMATPLMAAAGAGHVEACAVLLDAGAEIEALDENGWSALLHAASEDQEAAAVEMCRRGADRGHKSKGARTVAHFNPSLAARLPPSSEPEEPPAEKPATED